MPVECERLQGFPDVLISTIIHVCGEHQKSYVAAEELSPRLPINAWNAGGSECSLTANLAERHLSANHPECAPHVVLNARIDLEREAVQISNPERFLWSAASAGKQSSSLLHGSVVGFVRAAARIHSIAEQTTTPGRVALPASTGHSQVLRSGSSFVSISGREIAGRAADAVTYIGTKSHPSTSTTSEASGSSGTRDSILITLCSYVAHAIGSFIPERIPVASSFTLSLTTSSGWTEGASDSARYRMLGNAVCVPVAEWIGRRIMEAS
jgi:hypothetical protein